MNEVAQEFFRAGHPDITRWAFDRNGTAHDELRALRLLQPMTQRKLRLSEKGLNWVMARSRVSEEIRWARAVFVIFEEAYAQHTSRHSWFRTLEDLEASSVGLDLDQTKTAVRILILKQLITPDAEEEGHLGLTDLGKDTCIYPETLDARLGPRDAHPPTDKTHADSPPTTIIYNVTGPNARVNMNSVDSSTNIVDQTLPELFEALRNALHEAVPSPEREELVNLSKELEAHVGEKTFRQRYTEFVGMAAAHIEVITPFLPALTQLLTPR